jgi:DNA polymerase-3 subunit delta
MKLYSSDLARLLKKIGDNEISAILLHGPNQGFTKVIIQQIVTKFDLRISQINAKEINPSALMLMAGSKNFFGQREFIKICSVTAALNKEMKDLLLNTTFDNFVCFVAEESLPASGIRKFFEDNPKLASIGCYYDDEQTIARAILQQCTKNNKTIEEDALFYLKSHLKGDHQVIRNELDKLFGYTHDKTVITRADVLSTLSQDMLPSGDEMCIYFAKKQSGNFISEVQNLIDQNINEILIIRALIRYYLNVYIVSSKVEDGENPDAAIRSLSPPVFFKYVNDFKQVVRGTSSTDALKALTILQSAEVSYKSGAASFDFMNNVYIPFHSV